MGKFQCQKVFALNIKVFQQRTFLIYFDKIPCFLYLGDNLNGCTVVVKRSQECASCKKLKKIK